MTDTPEVEGEWVVAAAYPLMSFDINKVDDPELYEYSLEIAQIIAQAPALKAENERCKHQQKNAEDRLMQYIEKVKHLEAENERLERELSDANHAIAQHEISKDVLSLKWVANQRTIAASQKRVEGLVKIINRWVYLSDNVQEMDEEKDGKDYLALINESREALKGEDDDS